MRILTAVHLIPQMTIFRRTPREPPLHAGVNPLIIIPDRLVVSKFADGKNVQVVHDYENSHG